MEIEEGQLFSETGLEQSKRRITALGYFERVDVSTEQGSSPGQDHHQLRGRPRSRPAPSRSARASARSRTSSRPRRSSRPTCSATGSRSPSRRRSRRCGSSSRLRFFEPYFLDSLTGTCSSELYDTLYVFPDFARRSVGGVAHLRLRAHQPVAAPRPHRRRSSGTRSTRRPSSTFFGATPGLRQHLPAAAAREPLQLRARRLAPADASPTTRATTASSRRPASSSRRRPSSRPRSSAASSTTSATTSRGASTTPSAAARHARLGLRPQAEHRASASSRAPTPQGVPIFRATSSAASSTSAASTCAASARACRSTSSLDPNSPPIPNGANIGGNLEAYENLELEFPIIDKVGIRGVVFFDAGNAWNLEQQFCKTTPAPQFDRVVQPCFDVPDSLALPAHVDGLRHPLVLAARPAALRVGLPAHAAAVRETTATSSSRSATSSDRGARSLA